MITATPHKKGGLVLTIDGLDDLENEEFIKKLSEGFTDLTIGRAIKEEPTKITSKQLKDISYQLKRIADSLDINITNVYRRQR